MTTTVSCPNCNHLQRLMLEVPTLIACPKCGTWIRRPSEAWSSPALPPDDWSFIQVGSTGKYREDPFTISGRVRLQLRNDYKNIWCMASAKGGYRLLVESFASFTVYLPGFHSLDIDMRHLHAGELIKLNKVKVKGEFVEKCEAISCEGELSGWHFADPGFFLIQAGNRENISAIFVVNGRDIQYMLGERLTMEQLNLENIKSWNEWS